MNKKIIFTSVLTLILSVSVAFAVTMTVDEVKQLVSNDGEVTYSAQSGPDHYQRQYFKAGYQSGGERYATSSSVTAYTLISAEFNRDKTYIDWNAGVNTTLTTMASTSMPFLGNYAGDERSYWFRSATTTAATTITFAAGTGVDLHHGDASGDDLVIDGLDLARLTFIRKANSDVLLLLEKFTED